jgi:hypothetical protein
MMDATVLLRWIARRRLSYFLDSLSRSFDVAKDAAPNAEQVQLNP